MKTKWDYTSLAEAYLKRPDYSDNAIEAVLEITGINEDAKICDVGAGVAHLTIKLLERGYNVVAVEPNDAMRKRGIERTEQFENVKWYEGTGENTGMPENTFDLVTFGSSFNVTDRLATLKETKRILKKNGWFVCMWNNRKLDDSIQQNIENIIKKKIDGYDYGTRREDQTEIINQSKLFGDPKHITGEVLHKQKICDVVDAWKSHATLQRQAGDKFKSIIKNIENYLSNLKVDSIKIPYITNVWLARLK